MGWVLQLVETGLDNRAQRIDVMEISRSNNLRDIASLGLTLSEAKQLLARVQRAVVAAQARDHAGLRPDCAACGGGGHAKDWRPPRIAAGVGGGGGGGCEARGWRPRWCGRGWGGGGGGPRRFLCSGCGRGETATGWPSH